MWIMNEPWCNLDGIWITLSSCVVNHLKENQIASERDFDMKGKHKSLHLATGKWISYLTLSKYKTKFYSYFSQFQDKDITSARRNKFLRKQQTSKFLYFQVLPLFHKHAHTHTNQVSQTLIELENIVWNSKTLFFFCNFRRVCTCAIWSKIGVVAVVVTEIFGVFVFVVLLCYLLLFSARLKDTKNRFIPSPKIKGVVVHKQKLFKCFFLTGCENYFLKDFYHKDILEHNEIGQQQNTMKNLQLFWGSLMSLCVCVYLLLLRPFYTQILCCYEVLQLLYFAPYPCLFLLSAAKIKY